MLFNLYLLSKTFDPKINYSPSCLFYLIDDIKIFTQEIKIKT